MGGSFFVLRAEKVEDGGGRFFVLRTRKIEEPLPIFEEPPSILEEVPPRSLSSDLRPIHRGRRSKMGGSSIFGGEDHVKNLFD